MTRPRWCCAHVLSGSIPMLRNCMRSDSRCSSFSSEDVIACEVA
jgi:hypothetical protein